MAGAAYEATITLTDDETFLFTVVPRTPAGGVPTWANYTYEYSLSGCGVSLTLTEDDGIEIDETADHLVIGPADRTYRLPVGQFKHGFRMTEIASNVATQHFDGTVTVTEGNLS
jgi:hypothetical protein